LRVQVTLTELQSHVNKLRSASAFIIV